MASSGRPIFVDESFWKLYKDSGKSAKRFSKDVAEWLEEELRPKKKQDPVWRFRI